MSFDNTYLRIDLDAIDANLETIRTKTGVPVMVVVKADAYGHGAVQIARHLRGKCAFFGVSSILEAQELRQAGILDPILILGQTPIGAFPAAVREDVSLTIFRYADAQALSDEAIRQGKNARLHLAVDTGMSRLGMQATEEAVDRCIAIAKLPGLSVDGIFSHFATADCPDLSQAKAQAALFDHFCHRLREQGLSIPLRHMNNSAGLMNFGKHYDMVRSGIVTYGMYPSNDMDPELLPLQPAMQWLSRVSHVKLLPPGRGISYGSTYVTTRPTRVATVSVGYADGYRWSLSGRFYVLIRGKRAPILGRVCMDQLMVDVTDIPDVAIEDPVVLVGRSGEEVITMDQAAQAANTMTYEFVCGISRRVPRVYYRDGKRIGEVHYLLDYLLE